MANGNGSNSNNNPTPPAKPATPQPKMIKESANPRPTKKNN